MLACRCTTPLARIAVIDRDRCLPWAQGTPCIVCQEMCPTPRKAIELDKGRYVSNAQGGRDWVKRPTVIPELCIGCDICEYKCPVSGACAIVVERHAPGGRCPAPAGPADPPAARPADPPAAGAAFPQIYSCR